MNNQLTSVPNEIGNLNSLIKLYLSSNQLTVFPDKIGNLTALEILNIANNQAINEINLLNT